MLLYGSKRQRHNKRCSLLKGRIYLQMTVMKQNNALSQRQTNTVSIDISGIDSSPKRLKNSRQFGLGNGWTNVMKMQFNGIS